MPNQARPQRAWKVSRHNAGKSRRPFLEKRDHTFRRIRLPAEWEYSPAVNLMCFDTIVGDKHPPEHLPNERYGYRGAG
jgi:hypothetical protein